MKKLFLSGWLLILAFAPLGCLAQESNVPTAELKVVGLKEKVIIRRDERGIPYIEAANEPDLFFAQGFVTAQDRLWQMDLFRRVARGETAEIFGNLTLAEDKRWRKFGFARVAAETLPNISPEPRAALENYARGVNAYLATLNEKNLPREFQILQYRPQPWKPEDSIVVGKILSDALSTTWQSDLLRQSLQNLPPDKLEFLLQPSTPDDVLLVGSDAAQSPKSKIQSPKSASAKLPFEKIRDVAEIRKTSLERLGFYAEDLAASNNWVVSGKRTADGKPLLANDPHLRPGAPPIWCMVNLSAPNLRVAGVTFPGAPGVVLGHNAEIAWGATNVGPDVQDLYLETFDPKDARRYKTPSGFENAVVRTEEIKVRKSFLSAETTTEMLEVVTTRNGVIYFEDKGNRYALRWTALDPKNNELEAFFYLNRARNWSDFSAALKRYGGSMQNFVFADTTGNIGWYAAGRVPVRKTGDGSLPYDGATDDGAWTGFVPFEELPNLYNPPDGIIVTANQRIVGASCKYQNLIARDYDSPYRARRIYELLNTDSKLTAEKMRDVQHDIFNIAVSRFASEIVSQKGASEETIKLLNSWDGRMAADSQAALVATEMRLAFRNKIMRANLGAERADNFRIGLLSAILDRLATQKPKSWLPKEFANYAALFKACEVEARENLTRRLGADETKWTWGNANKITFPHPLAGAPLVGSQFAIDPLPLNGSSGAPNVGGSVSMRLVATPGNWDATRQVITSGQSGAPDSPHYKDQVEAWYSGQTPVFPFSGAAITAATKQKLVLTP